MYGIEFVDTLPLVILVVHFFDKWFLSKAKLRQVYALSIVGCSCTVLYNLLLWHSMSGKHASIMLFCINSTWTFAMAVKGLIMLHNKRKEGGLTLK